MQTEPVQTFSDCLIRASSAHAIVFIVIEQLTNVRWYQLLGIFPGDNSDVPQGRSNVLQSKLFFLYSTFANRILAVVI